VASDYELTRNYRLPRFDGVDYTVFVLEDVNVGERAALVRTGRRRIIVRRRSSIGNRWLTRIVRDIATRYAKADGSLIVHASAFVFDGRAYLVIGDSAAGKSTTAVALARLLPRSGWMGNDRMHLTDEGEHYRVMACPLPLAINKGSLDVMGVTDWEAWSLHAGFPPPGSDWDRFMGEDKLKLSSREVERYLGVRVVPEATLAGAIFPRVDPGAPYAVEPVTHELAADVIGRNCFSLDDNLYGEDWLDVPLDRDVDPPSLETFLAHIACLPLLKCTLGGGADVARLAADFERAVS
jgi:energy-coupling factor transporter ATP-binding protein EcfA2